MERSMFRDGGRIGSLGAWICTWVWVACTSTGLAVARDGLATLDVVAIESPDSSGSNLDLMVSAQSGSGVRAATLTLESAGDMESVAWIDVGDYSRVVVWAELEDNRAGVSFACRGADAGRQELGVVRVAFGSSSTTERENTPLLVEGTLLDETGVVVRIAPLLLDWESGVLNRRDAGNVTTLVATRLAVAPNPVVTDARISFAVPENQSATLGVYDVQGRLVRSRPETPRWFAKMR